jgi:hypothetical protein
MTNAERLNTFHTFAGMPADKIRAARASHMHYARNAPTQRIAARYTSHARACTWELVRRANVHA